MGELGPQEQKSKPKAKSRGGLFEEWDDPGGKHILNMKKILKMHVADINYVSFTIQIYNALQWQGKAKQRTTLGILEA